MWLKYVFNPGEDVTFVAQSPYVMRNSVSTSCHLLRRSQKETQQPDWYFSCCILHLCVPPMHTRCNPLCTPRHTLCTPSACPNYPSVYPHCTPCAPRNAHSVHPLTTPLCTLCTLNAHPVLAPHAPPLHTLCAPIAHPDYPLCTPCVTPVHP